jgi:radical SAM superfamily enzyme YgiQ (UPF0313 family)
MQIDVLIISPSSNSLYQGLAKDYAASEPNIWGLMLTNSAKRAGYKVEYIDIEADGYGLYETKDGLHSDIIDIISQESPKLILFVATGQNPNASSASMQGVVDMANFIKSITDHKIAVVGPHVNALPTETLEKEKDIDICLTNEGVYALINLLKTDLSDSQLRNVRGIAYRDNDGHVNINLAERTVPQELLSKDLPGMDLSVLDYKKYRTSTWHTNYQDNLTSPFVSIYTSLGCPFQCLRGETPVNTIYGKISIKELAENYTEVPVYTYDIKNQKVLIAKGIRPQKTGENKKLVRVNFDDGTHIDCTPDHKFLTWQQGNQAQKTIEYEIEAQNLKPKMSVRAIKIEKDGPGYNHIVWGRRKRQKCSRMIMEFLLSKQLSPTEQIHHKNKKKDDDRIENLEYYSSQKEHFEKHPEISERMKLDNPVKYLSDEMRKVGQNKTKGKSRTLEQRKRYRESKLGTKNPNYKTGLNVNQLSRIPEINHKVVSIEEIEGLHDTYCMEVPGYNWFFANDVLVHNCQFCMINIINRDNNDLSLAADSFNKFRYWEPEHMIKWFDHFAENGVRNIKIADELFVLRPDHCMKLCELIIERGYDFNIWAYTRVNTVKEKYLETFKKAGINWLAIGIESGSSVIRTEITKGHFKDENIHDVIRNIKNSGINVIGNYIFGLGHDNYDTMKETYDLMVDLNCEASNMYAAMALPGSPLYFIAKKEGWDLPKQYSEYGFLSYDCVPSRTQHLTAAEVLKFRDEAWLKYHTNPKFLNMVEQKFGTTSKDNILRLTKVPMKRKIYGY